MITHRAIASEKMRTVCVAKLARYDIIVDDISIMDLNFSKTFNQAIEAKVTAEQHALAAKNKLAQVQFEAEQEIAKSEGKAKAMKVEAEAMTSSPQILQLRALEKWDGVLPRMAGGAVPFIDVEKLTSR